MAYQKECGILKKALPPGLSEYEITQRSIVSSQPRKCDLPRTVDGPALFELEGKACHNLGDRQTYKQFLQECSLTPG